MKITQPTKISFFIVLFIFFIAFPFQSAKAWCGDGNVEERVGEECDDTNGLNKDGCSNVCATEAGWVCSGSPSVCVNQCGNGVLEAGEKCDSGLYNGVPRGFSFTDLNKTIVGNELSPTTNDQRAVTVSGIYAYVADNSEGLKIFNISNPTKPTFVGQYDTPGYSYGVAVSGKYAYVADFYNLQIINISNPSNPVLFGTFPVKGSLLGVSIYNNKLYFALDTGGFGILDIGTSPGSPFYLGGSDTTGNTYDVAVSGNFAYVADYIDGLKIFNILNPAAPTLVGSYNTPGQAYMVKIYNNHAYVADGSGGLQVIDISTPSAPIFAGSIGSLQVTRGLDIFNNHVYMADYSSGLQVVNISNPTNPTFVVKYALPPIVHSLFISGRHAYIANGSNGLQVIDVTNPPTKPISSANISTASLSMHTAIRDNYAYVADYTAGLKIINITNPANPAVVGTYNTAGVAQQVFVYGSFAYVADGAAGLQIINITNPISPSLVGSYNTPGYAFAVYVSGNYAYVADGASGLQILNISNPILPSLVGTYNTPDNANDIIVSGNYAYIADGGGGLQIINVSNPAGPTFVSSYITPNFAEGLTLAGNYAYIADQLSGLQIINVSNPALPTFVSSYNTPGSAYDVDISGNYVYVADNTGGMQILDISNIAVPVLINTYTPQSTTVTVSDDYAYITNGSSGLDIVQIKVSSQPNYCNSICSGYTASLCNNGFVESGEQCDRGPFNTTLDCVAPYNGTCTICNPLCLKSTWAGGSCGNGTTNFYFESCDDGNTVTEACAYGLTSCTVCGSGCINTFGATSYCGDSNPDVANGETCDDGALNGTPLNCNLTCSGIAAGVCGNSITETGETCDDGNTVTEACAYGLTSCTVCGTVCTNVAGATSYCGDNNRNVANGETCDNGALNGTPLNCNLTCSGITASICGNSITETGETCDDGNTVTEACAYGLTSCTVCGSVCTNVAGAISYCGDSNPDAANGETCDDGALNGTPLNCNLTCSGIAASVCGNSIVEGSEVCDDGNASNYGYCNFSCMARTYCGDTVIQGGVNGPNGASPALDEQCEFGNLNGATCNSLGYLSGALSCSSCTFNVSGCSNCGDGTCNGAETLATCPSDCTVCGDTIITPPEICDSNSQVCTTGSGYPGLQSCGASCSSWNTCVTALFCGDSICNGTETGVSCANDCSVCGDGVCTGLETTASCSSDCSTCGDGLITGSEACDDSGIVVGDGCGNTCSVELGFSCVGEPSICTPLCGNGFSDAGEACDDGNSVTETVADCPYGTSCIFCNDACDTVLNFTAPYCGDSTTNGPETCDFGAVQNNDPDCIYGLESCVVCVGDCSMEITGNSSYCGDGIYDPANEECDFDTGSLSIGGDGCSSSCTVETGYTCDIIDGTYKCVYSCGNGNFQPLAPYNEECDAGGENGIRCYANNYGADCQWCTGSCKLSTVVGKKCGDGSLYKSKEQCDDGGTANSDGCNYLCQKETGWKCDAYSPCKPISGDGYCIGGAYENCANNFGDCGPCSVRQIFTASRGQAFGAVGNLIKSITDMFPVPQLRIGIPGLNLNKAGIDSPPEITIGIPSGLIGAQSRTPFRINGSERFITIDNAGSDPDAPIDITFE